MYVCESMYRDQDAFGHARDDSFWALHHTYSNGTSIIHGLEIVGLSRQSMCRRRGSWGHFPTLKFSTWLRTKIAPFVETIGKA